MQPTHKTQVFIAGAGPVGLAAAIELNRRGFNTHIVDPDSEVSPQSRALAINPRTLDLMEPSGVTEALLGTGHRVNHMLVRYNEQHLFKIDLARARHRFNFLLCLPQSHTESILESILNGMGQHVERGTSLQKFETGTPSIGITLNNGKTENADILIGADGAHSTVRKSLGIGFPGESAEQVFGIADVELSAWPFPWNAGVATIREDHTVGFFPLREGFGRFVSTKPDTLNRLPREARVSKVTWETEFRINYRQASSYQQGNVFLAGDAAHIHSPVGGRGMNLGIEDACWLAWLIEQKRTSEYTSLRHPVGASVLKLTAQPTRLISSTGFKAKALRRWILPTLMDIGWVQGIVIPRMLALDTPAPPWL